MPKDKKAKRIDKEDVWICDKCGKEATYHTTERGKHEYLCDKHWREFLGY